MEEADMEEATLVVAMEATLVVAEDILGEEATVEDTEEVDSLLVADLALEEVDAAVLVAGVKVLGLGLGISESYQNYSQMHDQ